VNAGNAREHHINRTQSTRNATARRRTSKSPQSVAISRSCRIGDPGGRPRRCWRVRRHVLLRRAAHCRDWYTTRTRRGAALYCRVGASRSVAPPRGRHVAGPRFDGGGREACRHDALRASTGGSRHTRGRLCPADDCRVCRQLPSGPARGQDGSLDHAAARVRRNAGNARQRRERTGTHINAGNARVPTPGTHVNLRERN